MSVELKPGFDYFVEIRWEGIDEESARDFCLYYKWGRATILKEYRLVWDGKEFKDYGPHYRINCWCTCDEVINLRANDYYVDIID